MSKIDSAVMAMTLARGDIDFAISKCCQAKLAEAFGRDKLVGSELALAMEAASRALDGLRELLGERIVNSDLEVVATGNIELRGPGRRLEPLDSVAQKQPGDLHKFET